VLATVISAWVNHRTFTPEIYPLSHPHPRSNPQILPITLPCFFCATVVLETRKYSNAAVYLWQQAACLLADIKATCIDAIYQTSKRIIVGQIGTLSILVVVQTWYPSTLRVSRRPGSKTQSFLIKYNKIRLPDRLDEIMDLTKITILPL